MREVRTCQVADCGGRHRAKGYCSKHYQRMHYNGDLELRKPGRKPKGDVIEYRAAHMRLETQRGKARWYNCDGCPNKASDWALMTGAPNTHVSKEPAHLGLAFTTDIHWYRPLCRDCHRAERAGSQEVQA